MLLPQLVGLTLDVDRAPPLGQQLPERDVERCSRQPNNLPDATRARITACTDLARLETWLTRAAIAQTLQELFDEPG